MDFEIEKNGYLISTDRSKLDLDYVYKWLDTESYWSQGLPRERFDRAIEHSYCFGLYLDEKQIGFARVITDFSESASIWDLFIDSSHRGKGLGKLLVETIMENSYTQDVFNWFLTTENAHTLYEKYGFTTEPNPVLMTRMTDRTF